MRNQALKKKWGTLKESNRYSGISTRLLQVYVAENLVRSSLLKKPGNARGIRLIDLESLDALIEKGIGERVDLVMNRKTATAGKGGA